MQNRPLKHSRRGMTLVELLVVVTIMVLLLAVSVPMLQPMLESRKTYNAAQVLAGAFKHARTKAIKEQRNYALRLIPFETAPTTAIQLQLDKRGTIDAIVNPPDERVKVENGKIIPYRFDGTAWERIDKDDPRYNDMMKPFFVDSDDESQKIKRVQFNRIGRTFAITKNYALAEPYDELTLPDDPMIDNVMEYTVTGPPDVVLAGRPPTVMPHGTIVDLVFSGGEEDVPTNFTSGDVVEIMFSPAGYVDKLYVNGEPYKVNEMLYFCVGDWDRQVDADGKSMAYDKKTNLEVPATYWVTLHPKTGGVRIAENAPIKPGSGSPLEKARRFAKEHYFNVGN
jgi:prepilin-type N-terminal cleavage/methylation domain-containing protein